MALASIGVHTAEWARKNGCFQCLSPWGDALLSPPSLAGTPVSTSLPMVCAFFIWCCGTGF